MKKKLLIESMSNRENKARDLRVAEGRLTEKAKNHNYKYIDPTAVKNIMGKWAPLSIWNFSFLMECFIAVMNDGGASIMNSKGTYRADIPGVPDALKGVGDKLLKSNRRYKPGSWKLYDELNLDMNGTKLSL